MSRSRQESVLTPGATPAVPRELARAARHEDAAEAPARCMECDGLTSAEPCEGCGEVRCEREGDCPCGGR